MLALIVTLVLTAAVALEKKDVGGLFTFLEKRPPTSFYDDRKKTPDVISLTRKGAQPAPGGPALVVLVRHAEKAAEPADDPPLTPAGADRARALAAALRDTGVTAIVTTQFRRTRDTAEPIATARGIKSEIVQAGGRTTVAHAEAVAEAVRRHPGGVVLVVGHSNTVPAIIAALGGPRLPDICDPVHANLFVLVPTATEARLLQSRYGAADPQLGPDCKE